LYDQKCVYLGEVIMGKYDYYEKLEEEAYRDSVKPKKKPKKQKKSWGETKQKDMKRDKKNSRSDHLNRI
tara:strand:- start:722 stop:928 length:207 start_codon:yes stop_codon:yes gene_type:complete